MELVRRLIAVLLTAAVCSQAFAAAGITQSGDWTVSVGGSDLTGGAGTDLPTEIESSSAVGSIDVDGTASASDNWRIDVQKTDSSWPAPLTLSVKRTTDGSGAGSISGGTGYQQINGSAQTFFSGAGDRTGIDVQLKAGGLSVSVVPDTYSTTVIYTIVDN